MKSYDRLFIGGEWVEPSSTSVFDVVSPTTEELVGRVPEAQEADIDRAVAAAREAFDHGPWPRMTPTERAAVLTKVADAIRNDMQGISELISNEMGSPVSWGTLAQVLAPTMILDYYAGLGLDVRLRHGQGRPARARCSCPRSRSAWWPPSPRGTCRSSWPAPSWRRPCCRAARSCSSRPPRRRSTPTCWPRSSPTPACPRACSAWCRPAARSASTWSTTPAWTRSPSPGRPRPAGRSAPPAGPTSSGSASSWAASRRPSCWTTSTSTSRSR